MTIETYYVAAQKLGTPDPSGKVVQEVLHNSSIVLIDQQGVFRIKHDSDFDPTDLVYNINALLGG